jgi:hypothetical protein
MTTPRSPWWFPVLVCAAGVAVYANTLSNGFVWDDENLIVQNPLVKAWAQAPGLLTSPRQPNTLYYRPVQGFSLLVDYACFGLWPAGFHLTSLLVHALAGVLFYRFAARLLHDPLAGLCAALLFVVHPIHTEAVAYLSGRADQYGRRSIGVHDRQSASVTRPDSLAETWGCAASAARSAAQSSHPPPRTSGLPRWSSTNRCPGNAATRSHASAS